MVFPVDMATQESGKRHKHRDKRLLSTIQLAKGIQTYSAS